MTSGQLAEPSAPHCGHALPSGPQPVGRHSLRWVSINPSQGLPKTTRNTDVYSVIHNSSKNSYGVTINYLYDWGWGTRA